MKKFLFIPIFLFIAGWFTGCSLFPRQLENQNNTMLGIRCEYSEPGYFDVVYFALLRENDSSITDYSEIVESNYSTQYGAFILNAKPGTYVAIGGKNLNDKDNTTKVVFFPKEMVQQTKSKVGHGEMVFCGRYNISIYAFGIFRRDNFDSVQMHYYDAFNIFKNRFLEVMTGEHYTSCKLNNSRMDKKEEMYFYLANKDDFMNSTWKIPIENKIKSLKEELSKHPGQ